MDFGTAISTCFNKYVDFQGRARRSEYWFFALFNILVFVGITIVGLAAASGSNDTGSSWVLLFALYALCCLAVFLPGLAVAVRRLHDTDHSGFWILISFIPYLGIIGTIVLLVWYCQKGTTGDNRFGPDPTAG